MQVETCFLSRQLPSAEMQKARDEAGFSNLVRPSGFEPPTPTMSR